MYIYNSKINKNEKNILLEMYSVISIIVYGFSFILNVNITSTFLKIAGPMVPQFFYLILSKINLTLKHAKNKNKSRCSSSRNTK